MKVRIWLDGSIGINICPHPNPAVPAVTDWAERNGENATTYANHSYDDLDVLLGDKDEMILDL